MKHHFSLGLATILAISIVFFGSCSKETVDFGEESEIIAIWNEQDALRDFSIALSKVLSTHESARTLLKEEALKRFDNDYDVLFYNIKDRMISENKSLEKLIQEELGESASVEDIMSLVPTLTIYISDVTWLDPDGFCAASWDTSDRRVAVAHIGTGGICEKLYANGSYIGRIEPYTIPGGPVLIVKKNERVRKSVNTRSGGNDFEFIADAYNPACNMPETKGNNYYTGPYSWNWLAGQTPEDNSDAMSASMLNSINPDLIKAYKVFQNNEYALQNDYVCYGMTPDSLQGRLKNNVHLRLARFKIYPSAFKDVVDESGTDKNFSNSWSADDNGHGASAEPSKATVYSKLWSDGMLEIHINTYGWSGNTQYVVSEDVHSVSISSLFTVNNQSIKREQWGSHFAKWYITWRYSIEYRDETTLTEKWYYPQHSAELPTWDLVKNSAFYMRFTEHDSGASTTTQVSVTNKRGNAFSLSGEGAVTLSVNLVSATVKHGLGWSVTFEDSKTELVSTTSTQGDDLLLGQTVEYTDNYITAKISDQKYKVNCYDGGTFAFTILPYKQ